MFKTRRSEKGISPILATLLLIVIAVAAVIVTYAWVITFTTTQTQQAGAVLSLENIRYYSSSGTARNRTEIIIRNSGTADAKIVEVYWSSTGFSALQKLTSGTDYVLNPSTGIISAGSSANVTITWGANTGSSWSPSTTYYYKIVVDTGQYLEFSKKSPSS